MMKKRLVAFGLAGVMLMGMSMNVFADNKVLDENTKTGSTTLTYTVPEEYIVQIPATITFTAAGDNLFDITSTKMLLALPGTLTVNAGSADVNLATNDGSTYKVSIKNSDGTAIADATKLKVFTNGDTTTTKFKLVGDGNPSAAGEYTSTINFNLVYSATK